MRQPLLVPSEAVTLDEFERRTMAYLNHRATGQTPADACIATILGNFPDRGGYRANRAAHVVSVFVIFVERDAHQLKSERDMVSLMQMCCSFADHPFTPGSPYGCMARDVRCEVLDKHHWHLRAPLDGPDYSFRGVLGAVLEVFLFPREYFAWILSAGPRRSSRPLPSQGCKVIPFPKTK